MKQNSDKIYLVSYFRNDYEVTVFVTSKKSTATKYVTRFNKILKKWKNYYKQFEDMTIPFIPWVNDPAKFYRWDMLRNIQNCRYTEIPVR
jgi:hypothetical protein